MAAKTVHDTEAVNIMLAMMRRSFGMMTKDNNAGHTAIYKTAEGAVRFGAYLNPTLPQLLVVWTVNDKRVTRRVARDIIARHVAKICA